MNKYTLEVSTKFSIGDQVFILSSNGRRVEKGKISKIELGSIRFNSADFQYATAFSHWNNLYIVDSLSRAGDWTKLAGNEIYASYDEAVAARKLKNHQKFGRARASVRCAVRDLLSSVNFHDLDDKERSFYKKMEELCKEEGF